MRTWRKLITWRQPPALTERDTGESASLAMRERCMTRLASRGMPLWSEEPERCDGCGRELLLGERARLMCRGDELILACPLCADRLLREGYLALNPDAGAGATADGGLSLAG